MTIGACSAETVALHDYASGTRKPKGDATAAGEEVQPPAPDRAITNYQSNFAPNRKSRGATIVVGCRNDDPELQTMFAAGFAFVRL